MLVNEAKFEFLIPTMLLADLELTSGNIARARALYEKILGLLQENSRDVLSWREGMASAFAGLALVARASGQMERAGRLLGGAYSISAPDYFVRQSLVGSILLLNDIHALDAEIKESTYAEALAAGKAMNRDQTIAYALDGGSA